MIIPQEHRYKEGPTTKEPTEKKAAPSHLAKIQKCPGFFNGHTDATHGNRLHKLCQDAAREYYGEPIETSYQYASEKKAAGTIVQVLRKIDHYTYVTGYSVEHFIDLNFIPHLQHGYADIVVFSEEKGRQRADILEIKTGNGRQTCNIRQDNPQSKAYALGLLKQCPGLEIVYSWIVKPTTGKHYFTRWERNTIMTFENEINNILNSDGEIKPNEHCATCPHKAGCIARFAPGQVVRNTIEENETETGKEALLYFYLHRNEINGLLKEAKELFEGATPEEVETVAGFEELTIKQRSKKKFDIKALERVFMSKGISVQLLYHSVPNSVNQIEEIALKHGFNLEELEQYKINESGAYYLDIEGRY
jgi:hypothetical protein